ncbi:MAG: thrombospondin type 3 repeat-containing protein [Dehalococcoidia bacterium]|nr:thrombospondin type 3 repeat-containing protein [Dehalococcoidia bacterium]
MAVTALSFLFTSGPDPASATAQATSFDYTQLFRLCEDPFPNAGAPTMCTEAPADLAPDAPTNYSTVFNVPWGRLNFGSLATFSPPDAVITPGTSLPLGAIVGKLRSSTTLGLVNARCYSGQSSTYTLEVNFTFMNATTNTGLPMDALTIVPPTDGSEGALEPFRNDVNGNGLPDHVDYYPSYLNNIFDPDFIGDMNGDFDLADSFPEATAEAATGVNFNGDGDTTDAADLNNDGDTTDTVAENGPKPPLTPLARYSGTTVVAGTAVNLEFVQFEPGQLAGAGFDANNPFSEMDAGLGYPSIVILNDPTQPLSPSSITDFCSPLASFTILFGNTQDNPCTPASVAGVNPQGNLAGAPGVTTGDGVGCLNSNIPCIPGPCTAAQNAPINSPDVCANEVNDDSPADALVNDGCPFVGPPEAGADCADVQDDDGDFLVNDGCPASGAAESLCGTCVGGVEITAGLFGFGLKTSGGEADDPDGGGPKTNIRAKNPPEATGILGSDTHVYASLGTSLRDEDEDGYENAFDTCPYLTNTEDGRVSNGPAGEGGPLGGDMIDSVCDAFPAVPGGNVDGDVGGGAASPWANAQDNCPQIGNGTQYQTDGNIPRHFSAPNGGTVGDSIGDLCDTNKVRSNGHWHSTLDTVAKCVGKFVNYSPNTVTLTVDIPAADAVYSTAVSVNEVPFAAGDTTLTVNDATAVEVGDILLIEGEKLKVTAKVGNDLTVVRGIAGTADVAHAAGNAVKQSGTSFVYTSTADPVAPGDIIRIGNETMVVIAVDTVNNVITVASRGALGTTPAVHPSGATIRVLVATNDTDGDGFCDSLETTLGSDSGGSVGESGQTQSTGTCSATVPGTCEGAEGNGVAANAQCTNATDDDGDGFANDGCPTVGAAAEFAEQCVDLIDQVAGEAEDTVVNDGCFAVGHGNCNDGVNNDGDGATDLADAGCRTPESYILEYGLEFTNKGAGPDGDKDTVPDNDEPAAGPAGAVDDAINTDKGQQEEPHQVCTNDVNEDQDTTRDAFATMNGGGADGTALDTGCSLPGAGDTDSDGVANASDNCPSAANPTQTNMDGDGLGDPCDTNIDGDAATNAAEWIAGSLAHDLNSTPETANSADDDKDGAQDEPTNTATTTGVLTRYNPVADRDGDGWNDDKEVKLGTNNRAPCGTTGLQWPGDMPPSVGEGDNTMDIGEIGSFLVPAVANDGHGTFAKYNHQLGEALVTGLDRWRLDAGDILHTAGTPISIGDINALTASAAATARPPMLGGALRSYVGGASGGLAFFQVCPYP